MRPLPDFAGADAPFWQALHGREVRLQRCGHCGTHRFPAARTSPHSRSEEVTWVKVAPSGFIETWCVFHRAYFDDLPVPYTVIQVRLDCGVRLFSNPVDVEPNALRSGMAVEAAFDDVTAEITLLKFKPRKDAP